MAGRSKNFPCGHVGKGQYCHRCKQEEQRTQLQNSAQLRAEREKQILNEQLIQAPINLEGLPKQVAKKALRIIEELSGGKQYQDFRGKRMVTMGQRHVISIPIGRNHRLICHDCRSELSFIEIVSHETYNNRLASGGWKI